MSPTINNADRDTVDLSFEDDNFNYIYRIDTINWVIIYVIVIEKSSLSTIYSATYYYFFHEGIPVLEKVALYDSPDFSEGGYQFKNIVLNGTPVSPPLYIKEFSKEKKYSSYSLSINNGTLNLTFDGRYNTTVIIHNSLGKVIYRCLIPYNRNCFYWRGSDLSGKSIAPGYYAILLKQKNSFRVIPFIWQ